MVREGDDHIRKIDSSDEDLHISLNGISEHCFGNKLDKIVRKIDR